MAADGGALKRLFEKPLPENPTLLEALSAWNHTHRKKLVDPASFTEIFGELHFQEKPVDVAAAAAARFLPPPPPPSFPPPIRSIGRGGKPCVCFRSFRAEGRFVLMEVVIPGKDLLRATREGGRLRLQFAAAAAAVGVIDDEEMHGQEAAACVGGDTFA
uniref:FAF domain-containing protein n=1 Tax=Oryza barthii TaxID=65489 RepID=A0A0D3HIC9_9ORYZ